MSHGIRYGGRTFRQQSRRNSAGQMPRRRAARHAVRPRPSCMCNIPSCRGYRPASASVWAGTAFPVSPMEKNVSRETYRAPHLPEKEMRQIAVCSKHILIKAGSVMESRFPGRGDPELCCIRSPLLCEGFMEPWGAAAAASPPRRPQGGLWRLRRQRAAPPPSVYRENGERRTAYKRYPKLSIYQKPPR